jgi:phage shock protein A
MSILNRLNRLIKANINDAFDGREGQSLRSAFKEMESSLREARREQAEMRRGERKLVKQIREARDEADDWEERAMLALEKGDEELAREALVVKNKALQEADRLREDLREHRSHMEDIEASLEALEMKLQSQKSRLDDESRSSRRRRRRRLEGGEDRDRADAWEEKLRRRRSDESIERSRRSRGSDSSSRRRPSRDRSTDETPTEYDDVFDTDREFEQFDRMAGKIDEYEAEVEATRELSGDDLGDDRRSRLEERFREMEGEQDLRETKRKARQSDERERDRSSDRSRERADDRRGDEDDLSEKKRRMDRLSELKNKFGDDE